MKLVFIIGSGAVGKMTVGQQLMELTGLRLFHNHMAIEPVLEIFGRYDSAAVDALREAVFRSFAAGGDKGMIYTYMRAFDLKEDWDYVEHVKDIFRPYGTEFYYVELVAPQDVRLKRNLTENRLANKPSKRDTTFSEQNLLEADRTYRLESYDGEIPFDNYIKIDNSDLSPLEVAEIIRQKFSL